MDNQQRNETIQIIWTGKTIDSKLCKEDNNKHQSNGYMFSRTQTEYMQPYNNTTTNMKYYINRFNKEQELLDKGENNIEDEA